MPKRSLCGLLLLLVLGAGRSAATVVVTQEATLTAGDAAAGDLLGRLSTLSEDGNTALAGATGVACAGGDDCGAAYVFVRQDGLWSQQAKLTASDASAGARLGSVALSANGDTALAGAPFAGCASGSACGAAYVFVRSGGTWSEQARLAAADTDQTDWFGNAVVLSDDGNTAAVGAPLADCAAGLQCGAVYVFVRSGGVWTQQAKLQAADGSSLDELGVFVALSADGNLLASGAQRASCAGGSDCGAVYLFERSGGTWSQVQKLTASDGLSGDLFGTRVSLSADGSTVLTGAWQKSCAAGLNCGAAYIFQRAGGAWTETARLVPSTLGAGSRFGFSTALSRSGQLALAGSFSAHPAVLFAASATGWTEEAQLPSPSFSLDLSGDGRTAIVEAAGTDCAAGADCGAALIYRLAGPAVAEIPALDGLGLGLLAILLAVSAVFLLSKV